MIEETMALDQLLGLQEHAENRKKATKQNINQLPVLTSPAAKPLKVFHRWTLVCKIQMASKNVRQKTLKDNFRQKLQNVFKGALKQSPKPCRTKSLDVLAT